MQHVLGPPPARSYGDHGYVSDLALADPAAIALRVCRDGSDSLAARMNAVPERFRHGLYTECLCGYGHLRRRLVECPGGCSRWFLSDESGVWAVRLDG